MKIFLSYTSADRDLADRVRLALLARKHTVFFDRNDLPPGADYNERIAQAIARSDLFLFLISPASVADRRYTLTELTLAQKQWEHPKGHVLPVMIHETPIDKVPPYLKAVTILIPSGDIPAEVAEAVQRRYMVPPWLAASLAVLAVLSLAGLVTFLYLSASESQQTAKLLQTAQSLASAGEYQSAWTTIQKARSDNDSSLLRLMPFGPAQSSRDILSQEGDVSMAWLRNVHLREGQRFSDVVSELLPALERSISETQGERKADLLAHRGWAEFLRYRDAASNKLPDWYYRQALDVDPANVFAHTMWGHWIMWPTQRGEEIHGTLDDARKHFTAALASGRYRPYVRSTQVTAMRNAPRDAGETETLRIVYDMLINSEPLPNGTKTYVGSIYSFKCRREPGDADPFLSSLPPDQHMDLLHRLFVQAPSDEGLNVPQQLCLARLEEQAGRTQEALHTYQTLKERLTPENSYWPAIVSGIKRLSK